MTKSPPPPSTTTSHALPLWEMGSFENNFEVRSEKLLDFGQDNSKNSPSAPKPLPISSTGRAHILH